MENACLVTRTGWLCSVGRCQPAFSNFPATLTMSSAWWAMNFVSMFTVHHESFMSWKRHGFTWTCEHCLDPRCYCWAYNLNNFSNWNWLEIISAKNFEELLTLTPVTQLKGHHDCNDCCSQTFRKSMEMVELQKQICHFGQTILARF